MHILKAHVTVARINKPACAIIWACVFLFFFINALFAIVMLAVLGLFKRLHSKFYLITFALLCSVFLGMVNVTKVPESDLNTYLDLVELARQVPFSIFMLLQMREPGYFTFLFFIANIPWVNDEFFVFISTVISYSVLFGAIIALGRIARFSSSAIVATIIFFTFFSPLFNNSAHLMRQFMAGAVIAWFLVSRLHTGKQHWWILILAISLHSTAIILLPSVLISKIHRLSPLQSFVAVWSLFVFTIILSKNFANDLMSFPFIGYIASRVAQEAYQEHASLGLLPLVFVSSVLGLSLYKLFSPTLKGDWTYRWGERNIYITSAVLALFIISAHLMGETLLATRFLLYIYFTASLVFLLAMRAPSARAVMYMASLGVLPTAFFLNISNGTWTYSPVNEILMVSPLSVLFGG